MSHDPIDRTIDQTLGNEPEIHPSADFSWRVMRAVRHEADHQAAIPFPWRRLAASLVVSAGLTLAAVLLGDPLPAPAPATAGSLEPLAAPLAWLTAALVASLGVGWWSLRLAGR